MKPLEGVKVADFTWALVGPITTKMLADWGAEVVKIEGRSRPDSRRTVPPFSDNVPGLDRSGTFSPYNTNKLSVALNLTQARGIEVAKRVVAWADIVVDNFAGGAMKRMGLDYEVLSRVKPDIIMLSSCPMGQTGPYPTAPAIGAGLTALAGIMDLAGWPDRDPVALDSYTDFISPHFNATIILAALDYRDRTGQGQFLDLSQYEDCVHFMAPLVLDYTVNGRLNTRMGNRLDRAAPHNAYRCRGDDRWCAVGVFTEEEWRGLCGVIGRPELAGNRRFATPTARKENEAELDRIVEAWTMARSAEEVMGLMQAAGVPAGVVRNSEELLEHDPQLAHRRFFRTVDHAEVGAYRAPRSSFTLSRYDPELRAAPLLGEHNEYVLREIAGFSDDEIAELIADEIVE
ncbi:MAG: CoA transferase [Dehalococcoidales bacterium]